MAMLSYRAQIHKVLPAYKSEYIERFQENKTGINKIGKVCCNGFCMLYTRALC
jgi:hypothetical protein